jgi:cyclic-di-GMP-binding protein
MPSFDVVSEIDEQEVKNAVDQAVREVTTRFDFKDTQSTIELADGKVTLASISEDRLRALLIVLEEKFVKRGVSLKTLDKGKIEEATKGTARQIVTLKAGIGTDKAKEINRALKDSGLKIQSQTQGDSVRVTGKKRDDLQEAIAFLKDKDFDIPLQFNNFRD